MQFIDGITWSYTIQFYMVFIRSHIRISDLCESATGMLQGFQCFPHVWGLQSTVYPGINLQWHDLYDRDKISSTLRGYISYSFISFQYHILLISFANKPQEDQAHTRSVIDAPLAPPWSSCDRPLFGYSGQTSISAYPQTRRNSRIAMQPHEHTLTRCARPHPHAADTGTCTCTIQKPE